MMDKKLDLSLPEAEQFTNKRYYPMNMLRLYAGSDEVVTGTRSLSIHGYCSPYENIVEFETSRETCSALNVHYINSGWLDEEPLYSDSYKLKYTSIGKAIADTITLTVDDTMLTEALDWLDDEGRLPEIEAYLLAHNFNLMDKYYEEVKRMREMDY